MLGPYNPMDCLKPGLTLQHCIKKGFAFVFQVVYFFAHYISSASSRDEGNNLGLWLLIRNPKQSWLHRGGDCPGLIQPWNLQNRRKKKVTRGLLYKRRLKKPESGAWLLSINPLGTKTREGKELWKIKNNVWYKNKGVLSRIRSRFPTIRAMRFWNSLTIGMGQEPNYF